MSYRRTMVVAVALVVMLAWAAPALAGGWAIITLDALPGAVRSGETQTIGFTVRQHGITPTNKDLEGQPLVPVLSITPLGESGAPIIGKSQTFNARQEGATGHYVVDVAFPAAGRWAWSISAPTYVVQTNSTSSASAAEFEPLTVLPPAIPAAPAPSPQPLAAMLRWAGGALLLIALVVLLARRARFAPRAAAEAEAR